MEQDTDKRLAIAREKMHQAKIAQERLEVEDYENLLSSTKWKWFKYLAYFSTLIAILITIDTLVPGRAKELPFSQVHVFHGNLRIDKGWFLTEPGDMQKFQADSFTEQVTVIFGDTKKVCWECEVWKSDRNAPKEYVEHCSTKWNSIYSYFPGVSIALLLPIAVVGFKQRKPWFKFARYMCWLLIFPASIFLPLFLLS